MIKYREKITEESVLKLNTQNNTKIGFVSLGCDKNRVDLEVMMNALEEAGYKIVPEEEAEILFINTCAFILDSRKEAIKEILDAINRKRYEPNLKIVVSGCLPEIKEENLAEILPEVDLFIKVEEQKDVVELVDKLCKLNRDKMDKPFYISGKRHLTTVGSYAYVKIAEGCNNFCTYCKIPYLRGRFKSRPIDDILSEVKLLSANGVSEIILVAQDVTRYGEDLNSDVNLIKLLKELQKTDNIKWIRLLYCYPDLITDELINLIAKSEKICKYIDIPMQHVSDNILKAMNRHVTNEKLTSIVQKLKAADISIRSTFIVGFPGETRKDFNMLLNFLKTNKLNNVGFFKFSKEEGTKAAGFKKQTSALTKWLRLKKAYSVQNKISDKLSKEKIGTIVLAVCDSKINHDTYLFRSEDASPEIDKFIYVTADEELIVGDYLNILILNAGSYGYYGKVKGE